MIRLVIFLAIFIILPALTPSNLYSQEDNQEDTQKKPIPVDSDSKIKLSKFPDYGIYFLEDITIDQLVKIKSDSQADKDIQEPVIQFNYEQIILNLLSKTNEDVVRTLAEKINPEYQFEDDIEKLHQIVIETIEQRSKSSQPNQPDEEGREGREGREGEEEEEEEEEEVSEADEQVPQEVTTTPLFTEKSGEGIVLRKADVVDVYNISVTNNGTNVNHRMIRLQGDVVLYFGNDSMEADQITVNAKTKDIHGEGNVVLYVSDTVIFGDRAIVNLSDQVGYIFYARGLQEGSYYEGRLIRINRKGHYTLEDGWVTFSSNNDPTYSWATGEFDTYGSQKAIFVNSLIFVHNQPFFWFPYFIRYPVSTGLKISFGESRREGYYILTSLAFQNEVFDRVSVDFNYFEKLGLYLGIKNANSFLNNSYTLNLVLAYYTENENTKKKPNTLTYSHNTGPYVNSKSALRHKVEYSHKIDLTEKDSKIKTSVDFSLKNVSDPFISSTFPATKDHFDLQRLIDREDDSDESLFSPSASDADAFSLNYRLSAPTTTISIGIGWVYANWKDPNKIDESIDDQYTPYLSTLNLPTINFSHGGAIDKYDSTSERPIHFNIGYNIALGFTGKSTYKDGEPLGSGGSVLSNVEPYGLTKEVYNLKMSAGLNRPFSFDKDKSSLVDFGLDWFDWTITPSLSYSFNKDWEGKDYTLSVIKEDDKETRSLSYSVNSGMNFLKSTATATDFSINNSWSLSDGKTIYYYDPEEIKDNKPLEEEVKQISSSYSFGIIMNFPSSTLKSQWASRYTYHSMLPVFTLNLISYKVSKKTSQEKLDEGEDFALDEYTSRGFSSSLSGSHKGYGFLFLNGLDYIFNTSVNFSYNLMPEKNDAGDYVTTSLFDDRIWTEDRITGFAGNSSWNFKYKNWKWNNGLNYIFFRPDTKEIDPLMKSYATSTSLGYSRTEPLGEWFSWKSISLGFNWNYHFQKEDYASDSMSFSLSSSFDLLQLFTIAISFSSANPHSELYFEEKAKLAGKEQVNFFEDIFASLGVLGKERQQKSLFKMGSTSISIYHDLDDWFMSLSYVLNPVNYADSSFRGFYFDHRITFQVNLKIDKDPRGPGAEPFMDPIEENFAPDAFEKDS